MKNCVFLALIGHGRIHGFVKFIHPSVVSDLASSTCSIVYDLVNNVNIYWTFPISVASKSKVTQKRRAMIHVAHSQQINSKGN